MEKYSHLSTNLLKFVAACTLLIGVLLFTAPVKAESRELNAALPQVAPTQVAWYVYYGYRPWGYYHPYRYYNWGPRYYYGPRYYRPYWRYYRW